MKDLNIKSEKHEKLRVMKRKRTFFEKKLKLGFSRIPLF